LKPRLSILVASCIFFLSTGFILLFYFNRPYLPKEFAERISNNLEKELISVDKDTEMLIEKLKGVTSSPIDMESSCPLFVYDGQEVVLWTDNQFVPSYASVADTFKLKLLKAGNGDYLAAKWIINSNKFIVAIIPLDRKYNIANNYLSNWRNDRVFPRGTFTIHEPNSTVGLDVCIRAQCPFKITFLQDNLLVKENIQECAC